MERYRLQIDESQRDQSASWGEEKAGEVLARGRVGYPRYFGRVAYCMIDEEDDGPTAQGFIAKITQGRQWRWADPVKSVSGALLLIVAPIAASSQQARGV